VVVVVESDQVAELEVTGSGGGLGGNTLHGAAITEEAVGVVVDKLVAGLVEGGSGLALSHGETNGIGETLAERAGSDLDTLGVVGLGVTGGDAVNLAEVLEVVKGELVAEQVEQGVLQDTAVAVGEDEAVTVEPLGVLGVELHELVEQHVGLWVVCERVKAGSVFLGGQGTYDRGHAHGRTGVARVGGEGGINLGFSSALVSMAVVDGRASAQGEADPLRWSQQTYRESADGVNRQGVNLVVAHLCGMFDGSVVGV